MALITISSYDEFAAYLGKELGQSDWLEISQERINKFADATLDHQWIHVDTERAKVESPSHSSHTSINKLLRHATSKCLSTMVWTR